MRDRVRLQFISRLSLAFRMDFLIGPAVMNEFHLI